MGPRDREGDNQGFITLEGDSGLTWRETPKRPLPEKTEAKNCFLERYIWTRLRISGRSTILIQKEKKSTQKLYPKKKVIYGNARVTEAPSCLKSNRTVGIVYS